MLNYVNENLLGELELDILGTDIWSFHHEDDDSLGLSVELMKPGQNNILRAFD